MDNHFVHSSDLNSLVERIVRMKIEGLHILILSRTKPDISMDELMLKGYCYQIKSNVFEVSKDEIKGNSIEGLIETAVMSRYSEREVMVLKALCVLDSLRQSRLSMLRRTWQLRGLFGN